MSYVVDICKNIKSWLYTQAVLDKLIVSIGPYISFLSFIHTGKQNVRFN